jgi:hypothetical protein
MVTYRHRMNARLSKSDQQLHHVAMLKLVLRMKREPDVAFEALTQDVADSMKLDALAFRRFLAHYMPAFARTTVHAR